jgi:NAD-dependent deacetylase sirtuin 4
MRPPLLRVPYTDPLPLPTIIPTSAGTVSGAIAALVDFLSCPPSKRLVNTANNGGKTVVLTGAGISVASGLADYRGANGTYTLNKKYKPIYFNEFCENHEARKRYWARSFLGWTNLAKARPNKGHLAVADLGKLGFVERVITQSTLRQLPCPSFTSTKCGFAGVGVDKCDL